MEGFYTLRNELRERFNATIQNGSNEDKFLEFIETALQNSNKFDIKALEVILDLALTVSVEHEKEVNQLKEYPKSKTNVILIKNNDDNDNDKQDNNKKFKKTKQNNELFVEESSNHNTKYYDADDESSDETFIFPCHMTYENCHPDQLINYHSDHIKSSRVSIQLIKYPKLCEFVFDFLLEKLRSHFKHNSKSDPLTPIKDAIGLKYKIINDSPNLLSYDNDNKERQNFDKFIDSIVIIVRRTDRVCSNEKNNCRLLAKVGLLDTILEIIAILVKNIPQLQDKYLEILLKFAFTLIDYRVTSYNLIQLFDIMKLDNIELPIVLNYFDKMLDYHEKILKNIQPLKSLNFPVASTTADDIYNNSYISNSWHWRLRRKVIEFKKRRSRSGEFLEVIDRLHELCEIPQTEDIPSTPSWLECSFMTPLSNVSPLIRNGNLKFSCSLWLSVCGDLLVLDKPNRHSNVSQRKDIGDLSVDWRNQNGYWLKLISRRRLAFRNRRPSVSKRRPSMSRNSKVYDEEDEYLEELALKVKKNDDKANEICKTATLSSINQIRTKIPRSNERLDKLSRQTRSNSRSKSYTDKNRKDAQELMLHIVSFAIDTLTIEFWLNIKKMNFTAKVCRVGREGQSSLLDQVTFPSHLEANGNWSNVIFNFEETSESPSLLRRTMHLKLIIDGIHNETEKLIYNTNKSPFSNFSCLLGCERSSYGYVWKLSHVSVYKSLPTREVILYLLGKGPDFCNFTNFRLQSTLPMPDLVKRSIKTFTRPKILDLYSKVDECLVLNWITQNIVSLYVSHKPMHFLDYSRSTSSISATNPIPADYEKGNSSERFIQAEILNFSRSLKYNVNYGFGQALTGAGGMESMMISFFDIVRRCPDQAGLQSSAFSLLLKMSQTSQCHLSKFLDELNGLKLIEFILVHPNCKVSASMLDSYFDYCLVKKGSHYLVKSPKLLFHFISCWRAWHKDIKVAKRFYQKLTLLLQTKELVSRIQPEHRKLVNSYTEYNSKMFMEAGGIELILGILRECLVPLDDNVPIINQGLIELSVNLMSLLIKHPPGLEIMYEIMEFLIFVHPDPKAYVDTVTDRTSFLYIAQGLDRAQSWSGNISCFSLNMPTQSTSSIRCSNDNIRSSDQYYRRVQAKTSSDYLRLNDEHISDRLSENLDSFAYHYDSRQEESPFNEENFLKNGFVTRDGANPEKPDHKCSNRSFALAFMADILASMVKLSSSDPMRVLSEAFLKPVIDPRKLLVLANNSSYQVREKVLRLFLYCIKACYSLDLKAILVRYEQDVKGSRFKTCVPIQLMARQLLKYPTTIKMIQLCYSIIIGVDDFEAIETVCLGFNVESIDNNLQLNILMLLIQLMTQLQSPRESVSALRFVRTYIKQLVDIDQEDVLTILIENNLLDSLMKMYYLYVENIVEKSSDNPGPEDDDHADDYRQIRNELDRMLVLIVRYFSQNLKTVDAIKSIDDLMTYLDLINSYVQPKYQYILRERQVRILAVAIRYCKLYESSARQRSLGGKVEYYFRTIFKANNDTLFPNTLRDSQLELYALFEGDYDCDIDDKGHVRLRNIHETERQRSRGSVGSSDASRSTEPETEGPEEEDYYAKRTITESDMIERYKSVVNSAINFIVSRNPGTIPSPLERRFIIKYVEILSDLLDEYQLMIDGSIPESATRCHWYMLLPKLEKVIRANFSRLILFLLSPCESMNLDERKYYALKLLEMFSVDRLLKLLNDHPCRNTYKILCLFIEDLVHYDSPYNSDDSGSEHEDEVFGYDTEIKLKVMIENIEHSLGITRESNRSNGLDKTIQQEMDKSTSSIDPKLRDIWLADLAQVKEEVRERCLSLKLESQSYLGSTPLDSTASETVMMLDEALKVTHDVVNDKHEQRKIYLENLKQDKVYNYHIRQQWLSLIIGQTHERAPWHVSNHHPKSWELNPVEGPSRIRNRLRPCKLMLNSRFFRSKYENKLQGSKSSDSLANTVSHDSYYREDFLPDDWYNRYSPHPLCSMVLNHEQSVDTTELRARMFTTDRIHFNCDCSIIRLDEVCRGEISIASWCMHFIGQRIDSYQQKLHERVSPAVSGSKIDQSQSIKRVNLCKGSKADGLEAQFAVTVVEDLWFDEIVEILDRRYQLRDVGLEIFLTNNMTYLISFKTRKDREDFKQNLMREQHKMINLQRTNLTTNLARASQLWREGKLTNFDLLTCLNKLAGRSFNDLMQYPVFPFILSNYVTDTLDLTVEQNFRNLKRPMAIQNPEKEVNFLNTYHNSSSSNLFTGLSSMTKPYHYGNHYSNTATVLHFLVRLPPFTQMLIQYQDNNFDQPDRTFHSMANTWQLITNDSNTDFKELIPELFFLPELFMNLEQFDLGRKQNNELVDDVRLPLWCNQDPRLFTLIHRQALESNYVSENIHHWIDLIFGYKQTGKAAIEAMNVFHPATYYGMITFEDESESTTTLSAKSSICESDLNQDSDNGLIDQTKTDSVLINNRGRNVGSRKPHADIERLALETMIKTYGQMPRQLFSQPMKAKINSLPLIRSWSVSSSQPDLSDEVMRRPVSPLSQIIGLKWGNFVGSPDEGEIVAIKHKQITDGGLYPPNKGALSSRKNIRYTLSLLPNGDVAILRDNTSLILDYRADRKSGGGYLLSLPSTRHSRRAGLSNVARMNLFSNMIISRQQLAYVEPAHMNTSPYESNSSNSTSLVTTSRTKFSLNSLSKISWSFLDGTIRIKHPASNSAKSNVPLAQADSIIDSMSTCTSVPELNLLLVGYKSGVICAHIVSTSDETIPSSQSSSMAPPSPESAGPSALHFVHAPGSPTITAEMSPFSTNKTRIVGDNHSSIPFSGKALHTVKSLNKATRWLYCHNRTVNTIQINVGFGIVVTASDDGTSVIWDLNSLCYVRTIDYRLDARSERGRSTSTSNSLNKHGRVYSSQLKENPFLLDFLCNCNYPYHKRVDKSNPFRLTQSRLQRPTKQRCLSCCTGVSLVAISDTLGDIATVKHFNDRVGMVTELDLLTDAAESSRPSAENEMIFSSNESQPEDQSSSSVIYVHTINGFLVGLVNLHTKVNALCYSSAPEGVSVNVIAVGLADGLIRLYSSWDLSRVKEFHISGLSLAPISLQYTRDNQLLYVIYADGQLVVLRNKGRAGIVSPKEWLL